MNEFQQSENKGRALLKSFLDQIGATDQQPTEGEFDPVDYYFTYKGKKVVAEIKVRDIKYKDYPTHIIEDSKLNSLLEANDKNGCDFAYYINFFGEDTVYWYSTGNILANATLDYLSCNRTTAVDSKKVSKRVWHIPTDKAQIFTKIVDVWCR